MEEKVSFALYIMFFFKLILRASNFVLQWTTNKEGQLLPLTEIKSKTRADYLRILIMSTVSK